MCFGTLFADLNSMSDMMPIERIRLAAPSLQQRRTSSSLEAVEMRRQIAMKGPGPAAKVQIAESLRIQIPNQECPTFDGPPHSRNRLLISFCLATAVVGLALALWSAI